LRGSKKGSSGQQKKGERTKNEKGALKGDIEKGAKVPAKDQKKKITKVRSEGDGGARM